MAVERERPYTQFNFLVDLGTGTTDGPQAGFQEVSAISTEVAVVEYRNGNSKENSVIKITGLNKVFSIYDTVPDAIAARAIPAADDAEN